MSQHRPVAISLLLCDGMIVDAKTRFVTPVNCWYKRLVKGPLPTTLPFCIVAALTNGTGTMKATVSIDRLDDWEGIFERSFQFHLDDPLQEIWIGVPISECYFPYWGAYLASFAVDGEAIASRRFMVLHKEQSS